MTLEEFLLHLDISCAKAAKEGKLKQGEWFDVDKPNAPCCALGRAFKTESACDAVETLVDLAYDWYHAHLGADDGVRMFVLGFTKGFDDTLYHPDFEQLRGSSFKNGYLLGRSLRERYIDHD